MASTDSFPTPALNNPTTPEYKKFVADLVGTLSEYLEDERTEKTEVSSFLHPETLMANLKHLNLQQERTSAEEVHTVIKEVLSTTVRTGHRTCLNQLFHRADALSVFADWVTSVMNTSIYTYELAPVATLIELECIRRYGDLLGWEHCEGTFPPGGSTSNLNAVMLARTRKFPNIQRTGFTGAEHPCVFVSIDAHYSTLKACGMAGIGYDNVIGVAVDDLDRMCPKALRVAVEKAIAEGKTPICVTSTCGTTLTGAIDPIEPIADIAKEFDMWLHVDGCLGGGLIHSPTHRHALKGVERADSFAMNPHKMVGATQQCAVFVTSNKGMMRKTFSTNAAYLFNNDKEYDAQRYDVGDSVFQCGRKVDCLKLWVLWKYRGDEGMAAYIDAAVDRHVRFNKVLEAHPNFESMLSRPSDVPCTCFWWIPAEMREVANREWTANGTLDFDAKRADQTSHKQMVMRVRDDPELYDVLDRIAPVAKMRMMEEGYAVLTFSRLGKFPNHWRFVSNGGTSWSDQELEDFLNGIEKMCSETYEDQKESPISPNTAKKSDNMCECLA